MTNIVNHSSENTPLVWTIRIIALSFIAQMYLSLNLWFPIDRSYPTVPFLPLLDFELGLSLTYFFSCFFIANLLVASLYSKFRTPSLLLAIFCLGILLLEDINRFQVWVYIYLALLMVITWHYWQQKTAKTMVTLQFIMAMVYFWTGIQKLNIQFVTDVYTWLITIFDFTSGLESYVNLGYGIGLFELLLGCFLLLNRTVRVAVIMGILMHILILVLLIKDQWNTVVYPWNVAMICLLFILFWEVEMPKQKYIFSAHLPHYLILLLFGFVPLLALFKLAPHNLALGMYSGTSLECDLILKDAAVSRCVPEKFWEDLLYQSETESDFSLDDWAIIDLNVPPFASERVFKAVAREFCACSANEGGSVEFMEPLRWKDEDRIVRVTCEELLADL